MDSSDLFPETISGCIENAHSRQIFHENLSSGTLYNVYITIHYSLRWQARPEPQIYPFPKHRAKLAIQTY